MEQRRPTNQLPILDASPTDKQSEPLSPVGPEVPLPNTKEEILAAVGRGTLSVEIASQLLAACCRQRTSRPRRALGVAIEHIQKVFFNLGDGVLEKAFRAYREQYGERKCEYARRSYREWRAGKRQMTPELGERLLAILPPLLDFEERYRLLRLVWEQYVPKTRTYVSIDSSNGIDRALTAASAVLAKNGNCALPPNLHELLAWLTDDQMQAAQLLVTTVRDRECQVILDRLKCELPSLLALVDSQTVRANVERTIVHPTGTITITVYRGTKYMTNPDDRKQGPQQNTGNAIVPANQEPPVPAITNPSKLLDEAFSRLDPEKVKQLVAKAADEALDLQVKQKEAEIDSSIVKQRIQNTVNLAGQMERTGANYEHDWEQRSSQGSTRTRVTNMRQVKGSCFVATACFGDYDHPTVMVLRSFRDDVLSRSFCGRYFISAYYRVGPPLASLVNLVPAMKQPLRCVLTSLAHRIARDRRAPSTPALPIVTAPEQIVRKRRRELAS